MKNFIFKSSKGLIKNDSINIRYLYGQLNLILIEQRHERSDLKDLKLMLNRLLIDKQLQHQVDTFFDETSPQTDSEEHGN